KAHKTPAIARRQLAAGCRGFTCATLDEAEVLTAEGFEDVLIANEIVDPTKRARLAALAARTRLTVAVDSLAGADYLAELPVDVLVDVNIGLPRCGVSPDAARALADAVVARGLRLRGVMGYEGHAMAIADAAARREAASLAIDTLAAVAADLRAAGHAIDVVSAGGTGTYDVT